MRNLLLVLVCSLWPILASAQTPTPIPANAPFQLQGDHDGGVNGPAAELTTHYRCFLNNVQVGQNVPRSAAVNNVVTCPFPGQPAGTYQVGIDAVNQYGASTRPVVSAQAGAVPTPPAGLRVITVTVTVAQP